MPCALCLVYGDGIGSLQWDLRTHQEGVRLFEPVLFDTALREDSDRIIVVRELDKRHLASVVGAELVHVVLTFCRLAAVQRSPVVFVGLVRLGRLMPPLTFARDASAIAVDETNDHAPATVDQLSLHAQVVQQDDRHANSELQRRAAPVVLESLQGMGSVSPPTKLFEVRVQSPLVLELVDALIAHNVTIETLKLVKVASLDILLPCVQGDGIFHFARVILQPPDLFPGERSP